MLIPDPATDQPVPSPVMPATGIVQFFKPQAA